MTEQDQKLLYIRLGHNIKEAREGSGYKQAAFADLLTLSRASIVNIEKGRQRPSLHLIYQIAILTNTNLQDLLPRMNRKMIDAEQDELKAKWIKKINESSEGDVETSQKLTDFLKDITKTNPNHVPKKS